MGPQRSVPQKGSLELFAFRAEGLVARRPYQPDLVGGRTEVLELGGEGHRMAPGRGGREVDPVDELRAGPAREGDLAVPTGRQEPVHRGADLVRAKRHDIAGATELGERG